MLCHQHCERECDTACLGQKRLNSLKKNGEKVKLLAVIVTSSFSHFYKQHEKDLANLAFFVLFFSCSFKRQQNVASFFLLYFYTVGLSNTLALYYN